MESFIEERNSIRKFRELIFEQQSLSPEDLMHFADRFEEIVDVAEISLKMVDHLVRKHHVDKS